METIARYNTSSIVCLGLFFGVAIGSKLSIGSLVGAIIGVAVGVLIVWVQGRRKVAEARTTPDRA